MDAPIVTRNFAIRKVDYGKWWLIGSPRKWKPGDEWLVSHDVFHHVDGDTGSVEEEIMSFGAELWLDYSFTGARAVDASTLAGTLMEPFDEGPVTLKKLRTLLVPCPIEALHEVELRLQASCSDKTRDILYTCAQKALDRLLEDLEGHAACSLAFREQLSIDQCALRYAQWMMLGLLLARERYPDAVFASTNFSWLQTLVQAMDTGQVLKLSLTRKGGLLPAGRIAQKVMKANTYSDAVRFKQGAIRFKAKELILESHTQAAANANALQEAA